jgi:hypothetical protein
MNNNDPSKYYSEPKVLCYVCGYMATKGYHTLGECVELINILGKTIRPEIPKVFYDAFAEEAQQ